MTEQLSSAQLNSVTEKFISEVLAHLDLPDFKRSKTDLTNLTPEQRKFLAQMALDIYTSAKGQTETEEKLKLCARFHDCLKLLVCDPKERDMAYCPPQSIERTIFRDTNECLTFGTGTTGERVYFLVNPRGKNNEPLIGRYMKYVAPTSSATELGRKFYKRFCEAYGSDTVKLE